MFNAEEIRIAVGPRHALLLTWLDEPCRDAAIRGDDEIAADLNRAVIGQADQEWFHHPDRRPTRLGRSLRADTAACSLLGRHLLAGYSYEAALISSRRMQAIANLDRMVKHGIDDRIEIVAVEVDSERTETEAGVESKLVA